MSTTMIPVLLFGGSTRRDACLIVSIAGSSVLLAAVAASSEQRALDVMRPHSSWFAPFVRVHNALLGWGGVTAAYQQVL